ncbi:ATP-dependent Clp protease adaptor ClpS [Flammeovirga yaeyamensis]|uniref:ATP-dependent Clp protease adaptor ClpS n=1 Tax=Flammeovirga yaeyamensis TaxID=367791 RepID=A0AAX1N0U9_9BACT|nr:MULTISPECIES: ATP-dependent Clp protease adaptor ClpS [Flammeovirga]ANQ47507.1 ATP-dependent Clp protease adaptor ClpS [Flammeovirga sp. MY04]MBB3698546.1 ATP-dependent Clp protease adaptor protein ClpS [Flammeovirga yaeyamensis]NMF34105.1 ATP-dependent Clp protease adaptor ClpS [Flammeovirga yaeyamensis]QWG01092.1 ATP-dependent Clp protease adaptor ClpS [Flammeovirga yaeyamensis]
MITLATQHDTDVQVLEETEIDSELNRELIVFNDDVNTFEHVIDALIQVCKHTTHQAEQCTWIIHYNGKCAVKNGTFEELAPMRKSMVDRGISAEIL